ncbi:hypothetical protein M8756_17195 [Lutimaribacter sp. EGI FJ00015]|uniref:Uncharacterized protein n=1 Tax=Lutimaribacter degradans TaxID=2945989 RepID=A0ACC6A0G2_9RHOB|nr:hypothetical protein [Lutimaribacter sp. EGI FJ00013]MCM2563850.1 hypothetical protein [Lutimaribacter sp. EGI FJ00013]MCO0615051.1 hypothetical protein [Lutimaribacter sp. EGI FJ00015]MCO0637723.1 hypothetical protein [Lutimaribacter sp. EGI FJ00014]
MSNIDLTQLITAEARAAQAATARSGAIKAACRALILGAVGETAQANIAQAGVIYAAMRADGVSADAARAQAGFVEGDLETAAAWKAWVAAMQGECRRAIDAGDDPAWPALPVGVATLAARF